MTARIPDEIDLHFHQEMLNIYRSAKIECGYNATRFLQMVANDGGLTTAHKLLATPQPSDGFVTLWQNQRLDLTVEALILKPEYASLFTHEERIIARERLEAYGYKFC